MNTKTQFTRHAKTILVLGFVAATLSACGSDKVDLSSNKNVRDAVDAATGPLEDLNLRKREIPEPLKVAAINPYARPKAVRCATVREEIAALDELLGPDMKPKEVEVASADDSFLGISEVKTPSMDQVQDKVESGVGNYAHGTVMRMISSRVNIIPFRSVVRTVTGANRYQAKVTEAYEAGKLRRAYLKGFAAEHFGKSCLDLEPVTKKEETKPSSPGKDDKTMAQLTTPEEAPQQYSAVTRRR